MINKHPQNRLIVAAAAVVMVALLCSGAFAWGRGGGGFGGAHFGHGYGGGYYYHGYYGWPYYGPWWPGVTVVTPSIGAYVAYLPDGYSTIVIGNDRYYCSNGVYFQPYSDGYVVVSPPAQNVTVSEQGASANAVVETKSLASTPAVIHSSDTVSVGVPNAKGGFTSVKLIKQKDGYLGPQGEFYKGHASVDQLKALYGN